MHNISRYQVAFIVFLISTILTTTLSGQRDNHNYRDFQKKPYYFGLTIGVNNSSYKIDHGKMFNHPNKYSIIEPEGQVGLNLNMIGNFKLGDYFDFRAMPGFSFTERRLIYTEIETGISKNEGRESVFFELPIHVRYKSQPYKDKRIFLVSGIKYSYDVTSNSESKKSTLKFSPHDYQIEVGVGMQFFYPYFIFSPELKYSRGLGNTLIYDQNVSQTNVLEGIISQMFTLSFHFEG